MDEGVRTRLLPPHPGAETEVDGEAGKTRLKQGGARDQVGRNPTRQVAASSGHPPSRATSPAQRLSLDRQGRRRVWFGWKPSEPH